MSYAKNKDGSAKRPPWAPTHSGKKFYFDDMSKNEYDIDDIAHGLAHSCRWAGQGRSLTVAEHSVAISKLVEPKNALWGLLHDGSEFILPDLASASKAVLPDYCALETRIQQDICRTFGLPLEEPENVKAMDVAISHSEAAVMFDWYEGSDLQEEILSRVPVFTAITIYCHPPALAKRLFLARYRELTGG